MVGFALGLTALLGPDDGLMALAALIALAVVKRRARLIAAVPVAVAVFPVWAFPPA